MNADAQNWLPRHRLRVEDYPRTSRFRTTLPTGRVSAAALPHVVIDLAELFRD